MTNILTQKSLNYFEWRVQAPSSHNSTVTSEAFLFQEHKCNLQFYSGCPGTEYHASLTFKSIRKLLRPVAVAIFVDFDSETSHASCFIEDQYETIWSYKKDGSICSTCLTFKVIFHIDSLTEDKCIQTASYMNANISMHSLPEDFSKLLDTGLDYDMEMKCSGDTVKVHKLVLSTRSDVFKAMLRSDMLESQTGVVEIKDLDVNYFRDFVKYLYSDIMPELSFDKAKALYEVGDKYAVKSLVIRCSEYLQENVSLDNIFECYVFADAYSDEKLKGTLKAYILEKQVYLQDEYWLPFEESFTKLALEVYRVCVKEIKANKDSQK